MKAKRNRWKAEKPIAITKRGKWNSEKRKKLK